MVSNKPILEGLEWALTPFAKAEVEGMQQQGLSKDLAIAMLDYCVEQGLYDEKDVYTLPKRDSNEA